ncbi:hypothetical protein AB1Y20_018643 [Prymnesium parvum]|uniref:Uncharacterized protein n=1 Tax=Prymnesium parvum TaxID=97485 RepID=A0AB34JP56_PRYPA
MAAVGLLLCLGVPCSPRCPCRAANAASLLTATSEQAASLARAADAGIVDRAALERTTDAAGGAKDVLLAMHAACAAACAKGCRGCRVARLLNQTLRLERGVDDAVELGYFVDDERTMTALPEKLRAQAALAASIARSLRAVRMRVMACPHAFRIIGFIRLNLMFKVILPSPPYRSAARRSAPLDPRFPSASPPPST